MPDLNTILLFSLAALALTITPGPDMLLVIARSMSHGRTAGLVTYLGIASGLLVHALASAIGLSQLFVVIPITYDIVRYLGAAYLLFLAWQAFRSNLTPENALSRSVYPPSSTAMFRQGFLTNVLNPKVALFFLALFPQFIEPNSGSIASQTLVLAVVFNLIAFLVNGVVILVASRMATSLTFNRKFTHLSRYFLGTVFVGLAAKLAFDEQR